MKWDAWFRRRRWERRMDAELRFHLQSQIEDYVRDGLSRVEAERRARADFGEVELAKDECRDERPAEWFTHVARDAAYAWRSLQKSPGFTLAAVLTVALGVGANTAIFSVVHSVLLKPLPYASPDQLYSVDIVIPERRADFPSLPATVQTYLAWRKADTPFSSVAAYRPWECNLTSDGEPERVGGARVSANFFDTLGVPVALGRGFSAQEERPGSEKVVVISDALWRRRYGADPAVVGRMIEVNGDRHLVVGVAAERLLVPTGTMVNPVLAFAPSVHVWKPIAPTARELQGESWDHGVFARLRDGQSPEQARLQLHAILKQLIREQAPDSKFEAIPRLVPIRDIYSDRVRLRLMLTLGASSLLLLIACTNFANLLLARAASRATEFATRLALGAGRARILSQALTEATLLALAGGALGLILAWYGAGLLAHYGPADVRMLSAGRFSVAMFLFALAASLLTGILCGMLPGRQAYRVDVAAGLQEGARTTFGGGRALRFRQTLVGVEMALGTVLLVFAGLLLHSFVNVMGAPRGYAVERVLAVDLSLFGKRHNPAAFYRQAAAEVRSLPGIVAAGAITDLPAAGTSGATRAIFYATDTDFRAVMVRPVASIRGVTEGYFAASGTALKAGRYFGAQETTPSALISQSLASALWPGESAAAVVGRALRQGDVKGPSIVVTGVVEDVRSGAADRPPVAIIYRPYEQWASGPATIVARTDQEPAAVAPAVRAAIRKMDASLPIPALRTMREIVSTAVAERQFQMVLTVLFAVVALILGAVGVYGVVSYSIACRTREIGLRIALGAMKRDVMGWVFSSGMKPVLIGLAAGLIGAVAGAAVLKNQLFGIAPTDPASLGTVVVVLLLASGLACYVPARRAAGLDPMTAIRHE